MAAGELAGVSIGASGPVSGAAVSLYLASRIAVQPAQGAAAPGGAADYGPVASGTAFGAVGAFTFTGVAEGDYYVLAAIAGVNYWAGPFSVVENSDVMHLTGTETVAGAKTFSGGVTFSGTVAMSAGLLNVSALAGVLPLANGGTGSATQNFVDLTTAQSVGGVKTHTATDVFAAGLTVSGGAVTLPNASIQPQAINGLGAGFTGASLSTSQTFTGQETMANDVLLKGGQIIGTALATATAPTATPAGTTGSTTYQYQVVATSYDGRDGIPSPTGQTTTGNAVLSPTNNVGLSWAAVPNAATYTVLKFSGGVFKRLAAGLTGTTFTDDGSVTPSVYIALTANPGGEINGRDVQVAGTTLPRGTLGYAQIVANSVAISGAFPVAGLSVTVTVPAGRRIRVTSYTVVANPISAYNTVFLYADGAQVQQGVTGPISGGSSVPVLQAVILTPAAGSHTYSVWAAATGGTSMTVQGAPTAPAFIHVEDVGV